MDAYNEYLANQRKGSGLPSAAESETGIIKGNYLASKTQATTCY